MVGIYTNQELSDDSRRDLLFEGNLLLYGRNSETEALVMYARELITAAFAPHDPQRAQFHMPVEAFVSLAGPLKTRFTNAPRTKELVRGVLDSFDCDLAETYFDVPRLRVVPHGGYLSAGVSYAYKAHRDIWYASPTAQVNWWMPVFPITANRAMSFFPEYWGRSLKNSSPEFDYAEWCRVGRQQAVTQVKDDIRKHPLPLEPVSTTSELRIAGSDGDTILFSASHLHATAPNDSGVTRFSIDFRTLNRTDLDRNRGAPNIDSGAVGTTLGDFLSASDFQPFGSNAREVAHVAK